jgi:hypothetical protein
MTMGIPPLNILESLDSGNMRSDLKSCMGHIGTPDFSSLVDYVSMVNMMHHGDIVD